MKKLLSILGVIGLTATSTTTLISCEKPNNNENGGVINQNLHLHLTPTPEPEKPQQPPENSNWKLILDYKSEFNKTNKKWYIIIFYSKYMDENKFVAKKEEISIAGVSKDGIAVNGGFYKNPIIYRWDGNGEPQIPAINPNTGKITDWKG